MSDREKQTHASEWRPDPEEVSRLAYMYYHERGYAHGFHEDDWNRAYDELRRRGPRTRDTSLADRTVVGVFGELDRAQRAYDDLLNEDFSRDEISFIVNKSLAEDDSLRDVPLTTGSDVATDAGIGAAVGGVGGLLLGFAGLAVPGIGPILAAGPILSALGGAGLGAAAGGLIGAFTERGIPRDEAAYYAEGVRRGDIVMTVHAAGIRADRAQEILDRNGAIDIDDRVAGWRGRGWTRYDESLPPLGADELRREREYYDAAREQGREWARRSRSYEQSPR